MKNFSEWYTFKEAVSETSTEIAFDDAENKVKEIFSHLHKIMMNTWGKQAPSWDSQIRNKVILDLQSVIEKLKGSKEQVNAAKAGIRESVVINEGRELPNWMKTIMGTNRTITVDRMLSSMQNEVIKILHQLRDDVLVKQVSKVGTRLSRNIASKVKGVGKEIQSQISQGVRVHQDITGAERSSAKYNLLRLYNALKFKPVAKLYSSISSTRALKFNPENELEVANVLDKINKGRSFRLRFKNKDHFFDITSEGDVNRILELLEEF